MPGKLTSTSFLAAIAALFLVSQAPTARPGAPVVAAASDLQFALEDLAAAFTAETGLRVRLSMGSTGNIARQIREGAPFEIFLAADEDFILDLHRDGFTRNEGDLYAIGRLVIMVPHGSALAADAALDDLSRLLVSGQITRFAIANPDHAPYGMRAREALIARGLWDNLQPFLLIGENVSQAAQFALSGSADGGLIAYSLALAPQVSRLGSFAVIPDDWHSPLRQRMALLSNAGPEAEAFYTYLLQPEAREILERYGFSVPEE